MFIVTKIVNRELKFQKCQQEQSTLPLDCIITMKYWKPVNHYSTQTTIKPLKSGRLGVLKNLSVIERCPLLGGDLKRLSHLGLNVWSTSFFTVLLFSKKEITFMTL